LGKVLEDAETLQRDEEGPSEGSTDGSQQQIQNEVTGERLKRRAASEPAEDGLSSFEPEEVLEEGHEAAVGPRKSERLAKKPKVFAQDDTEDEEGN
jgi:hypothetical protein